MIEVREVIIFLLGMVVFVYVLDNRRLLNNLPSCCLLLTSFISFLAGSLFTLTEDLTWPTVFNFLEHLSNATGSILLATWCWRIFHHREVSNEPDRSH